MEEINTNQTTPEEQQAQQTHEEEMIAKAEELEQRNDPERPDWLPEKFKDAEQLAQAYKNLESKLGSREEEVQEETQEEEVVPQTTDTTVNEVSKALDNVGLDYNAMQQEYNENGGLSQDTMDSLAEKGFSNELVNSWIAGQEAILSDYQASVYDSVGGEEAYGEMTKWAADNLSDAEIQAYDRAITSGDIELVKLTVEGLRTKYQAAEGADPQLLNEGQSSTSSGGAFSSWAEVTQAMQDTRYESDVAYRQQVSAKLARSQLT
tara:strand:- start:67 stop:858 length:792 start_codon:yes stop_codon:yes gene_type:complete